MAITWLIHDIVFENIPFFMYFYEFIVHLCVIKDNDPAIMNEKMKRILFVMLMAVAAVGAWAKG